eukprot:m.445484 g.445484  ORF g.445484 m.445484 type:complete len:498 (+) comp19234_c0_seq1:197-1690(+)
MDPATGVGAAGSGEQSEQKQKATAAPEGAPTRKKRRGFSNPDGDAQATASAGLLGTPAPVVPVVPPHISVASKIEAAARLATVGVTLPPLSGEASPKLAAIRQYIMQETVVYRRQLDQLRVECNPLLAQQQAMAKHQAFLSMGRVYIGSLIYATTQLTLKTAFDPFGTIRSIDMPIDPTTGAHKGYAFLEYDHPEAADMAITHMNMQELDGRQIKVGRPAVTSAASPIALQISGDPRNNTRIYVSSVFSELSEGDIHTVFEAFGTIVSCIMCPDPANAAKHRGFGFIEFETEASAVEAVTAMHNFDLAGHYLRVCKAITLPEFCPWLQRVRPPVAMAAAKVATEAVVKEAVQAEPASSSATSEVAESAAESTTLEHDENIGISGTTQRFMMMQKLAEKTGSRIVVLRNMVEKEDVDEALESEVQEECEKHGSVEKVLIYEEFNEATRRTVIKLFVKFVTNESARKCIASLNGRFFGGKVVTAEEYDEDRYTARDYSG